MQEITVVVCGATGNQGGAVVRHALRRPGWRVIALSRNPQGTQARGLMEQGVKVQQGDLEDAASLREAFRGADYVFGVTQPWTPDYRKCFPEREVAQGKNIVAACKAEKVRHLVFSSAAHFLPGRTGIPHVDSKLEVEEEIEKSGLPFTFLQPAQFMDNIGMPFFPIKKGVVRGFVDGEARVPYVAVDDIGAVATLVFENPESYSGKGLNLVGDFVSGLELCEILGRIRGGERFRYRSVPKWLMRLFAREFYLMRKAFEDFGRPPYRQDVQELIGNCRALYPEMTTVEQHLLSRGFAGLKL